MKANAIELQYKATCRNCGRSIEAGEDAWYDGTDNDGSRIWCRECLPDGELEPDQ